MRTLIITIMATILLGAFAPVHAANEVTIGATHDATSVPRYPLAEFVSTSDEDEVQFLARAGEYMRHYSDETGFETCGYLAMPSDGSNVYGLRVVTVKSHVACISDPSDVPAGMAALPQTVHTHGKRGGFMLNSIDLRMVEGTLSPRIVRHSSLNRFSPDDYARGPGFLIGSDRILFQHGDGTAVVVEQF